MWDICWISLCLYALGIGNIIGCDIVYAIRLPLNACRSLYVILQQEELSFVQ